MMSMSLSRCKMWAAKHSPEICIALGIAGFVGTVIMAVKATPKAAERLEEARLKKAAEVETDTDENVELNLIEKVKIAGPIYAPAFVVGALSITSIIFSHKISAGRIAGLTSTCTLLSESFREYKNKVREVIGEKKAERIETAVATEVIRKNPAPNNMQGEFCPGTGNYPCLDVFSGDYFWSNKQKIKDVVDDLNYRFTEKGGYEEWIPMNDLRLGLCLSETEFGEILGFPINNGPIHVSYGSTNLPDGTPVLTVMYDFAADGEKVEVKRPLW